MLSNISMKPIRSWLSILFIFSVLSVGNCFNVFAASTMNVQGKLTDTKGNPITGIKDLYFRIYNSDSIVAAPLWTEQHNYNLGNDGLFNVRLGETASLDTLSFDKQLYLGISVNGENEMMPRQVLTSSPYALGSIGDFSVGKKLLVGGNVGIGTANPWTKLHISAGDDSLAYFGPNASWGGYLRVGAGRNDITTGRAQVISTNGNLHLDSASNCDTYINYYSQRNTYINPLGGNVGIGTVSPQSLIHTQGSAAANPLFLFRAAAASDTIYGRIVRLGNNADYSDAFNLNFGWRNGVPYIQADRTGVAAQSFALNPDGGNVGVGTVNPGATLTVDAPGGDTMWNTAAFRKASIGPNWSHVHWGAAGDWYIRSAASNGRVIIQDSGGNVGIGTASPATKLHISAGDNSLSLFGPNSSWGGYLLVGAGRNDITTGRAQVISTNGNLHLDSASNCDTYINYYSQRNTYINPRGGNVGIGTDAPGTKLDVAGDVTIRGSRINLGTDGAQHAWIKVEGTHALGFRFSDRRVVVTDGWSKNFMISHPLDPQHKYLLHSTLEGPENGVYYRGEAQLINGKTVVQLPSYFEALTRKEGRTVSLTSKFESDEHISMLAASEIKDGRFGVRMIDEKNPSQKFYWEVKAVRADLTPLEVEIAKDE